MVWHILFDVLNSLGTFPFLPFVLCTGRPDREDGLWLEVQVVKETTAQLLLMVGVLGLEKQLSNGGFAVFVPFPSRAMLEVGA